MGDSKLCRFDSMIDAILAAAEHPDTHRPALLAVIEDDGQERSLDYEVFAHRALAACAALHEMGVRQRDLVILALPTSVDHLLALAGCVLLGAMPCTVPLPGRLATDSSKNQLYLACRTFSPRLVIAPDLLAQGFRDDLANARTHVIAMSELRLAAQAGGTPVIGRRGPHEAHHVQLTSGSTGRPKAAVLTHRNVLDNSYGIGGSVGYDTARGDASGSWLPLFHDLGLLTLLSNIAYQSPILLMQPSSFIRNPLGWLKRIAAFGATTTASPTFGLQYCVRRFREASMREVDLSRLRNIFIGAERVDEACLRDFADRFGPYGLSRSALQPCYGMAESTLATTMHDATRNYDPRSLAYVVPDRIDSEAVIKQGYALPARADSHLTESILSMGRPIPGMELRVIAPAGTQAHEREVGEIHIRGTSIMSDYLPAEGQTERHDRDSWFATGDLGYLLDGELYVLGRKKEIIIIRGNNYFPHEIEDVVAAHPGLSEAAIVAAGVFDEVQGTENIVLFIESETVDLMGELHRALQAALREAFGFGAQAIVFVRNGSLPRTSSGKLQRLKCRDLYVQGRLAVVAEPEAARLEEPAAL
ncbi:AMP-binding protein [Burkholderia gladioli]|nr:AMP-binding protein [Burkholderia gladioli]